MQGYHKIDPVQMQRQAYSAHRLMSAYTAYAIEIGCEVHGDSILCGKAQARLLEAKWDELTGALFDGED